MRKPGGILGNGSRKQESLSVRGSRLVRYAGRDQSAAPATGIKKQHVFEEQMLVSEALFGGHLKLVDKMVQGIPVYKQ